jgi:hypothetical protein
VIAGYFYILAKDMDEAMALIRGTQFFFEDGLGAKNEVRPIRNVGIN